MGETTHVLILLPATDGILFSIEPKVLHVDQDLRQILRGQAPSISGDGACPGQIVPANRLRTVAKWWWRISHSKSMVG